MKRLWITLPALLLLLAVTLVFGVGWYFSNQILVARPYTFNPLFEIVAADETTVTLPPPPEDVESAEARANTLKTGRYGFLYDTGYGRLGDVSSGANGGNVVRGFEHLGGELPAAGVGARLDNYYYYLDPQQAHGLPFRDLTIFGFAGPLRAWWIDNSGDVAVLMLHGRTGNLEETLRPMPTLVELGYPVMSLAYRNHDESVRSPDGFYHYGATEYEDVLAGFSVLRQLGYDRVVLYGYSMGGAVALETLEALRAEPTDTEVVGLILDSPMLDARAAIIQGARRQNVPFPETLGNFALWVASLRADIDWDGLDQVVTAPQLDVPVLLIQGRADIVTLVSAADRFAERVTAPLRYEDPAGVRHAEAWNQNPEVYDSWLSEFLEAYVPLAEPQDEPGLPQGLEPTPPTPPAAP